MFTGPVRIVIRTQPNHRKFVTRSAVSTNTGVDRVNPVRLRKIKPLLLLDDEIHAEFLRVVEKFKKRNDPTPPAEFTSEVATIMNSNIYNNTLNDALEQLVKGWSTIDVPLLNSLREHFKLKEAKKGLSGKTKSNIGNANKKTSQIKEILDIVSEDDQEVPPNTNIQAQTQPKPQSIPQPQQSQIQEIHHQSPPQDNNNMPEFLARLYAKHNLTQTQHNPQDINPQQQLREQQQQQKQQQKQQQMPDFLAKLYSKTQQNENQSQSSQEYTQAQIEPKPQQPQQQMSPPTLLHKLATEPQTQQQTLQTPQPQKSQQKKEKPRKSSTRAPRKRQQKSPFLQDQFNTILSTIKSTNYNIPSAARSLSLTERQLNNQIMFLSNTSPLYNIRKHLPSSCCLTYSLSSLPNSSWDSIDETKMAKKQERKLNAQLKREQREAYFKKVMQNTANDNKDNNTNTDGTHNIITPDININNTDTQDNYKTL